MKFRITHVVSVDEHTLRIVYTVFEDMRIVAEDLTVFVSSRNIPAQFLTDIIKNKIIQHYKDHLTQAQLFNQLRGLVFEEKEITREKVYG